MRSNTALMAFVALVLALPARAADISFARDIVPIFEARCVACHLTGKEPGKLALRADQAYTSLVNKASSESPLKRVVPADPDASYLLHKLDGTHSDVGGGGVRMAFGAKPLSVAERHMIRDWIIAGAPNN